MGFLSSSLILLLGLIPLVACQVQDFISIDCGGAINHTDLNTGLLWISDTGLIKYGKVAEAMSSIEGRHQYQRFRYFLADGKKYCYTLRTVERNRYLVRATFLYGNSSNGDPYPMFHLYLDSTKWSTITINDPSRVYVAEMIIRAPSNLIDVCLCCASTGNPFISTLELRPLNGSMYATDFEDDFFLNVAARVNFGAADKEAVRFPDDPYDRIWDSDLVRRQNFLVGVAAGTERISTSRSIDTNRREFPPVKVMQTAVVGTKGSLTYRLNLDGFPANARAYAYLAEIEDLGINETRKFMMKQPYVPDYSNAVVNIAENANGSYILYEPSYMNISLDFVLSFAFVKTWDSTRGPLLNAIEINQYVQVMSKTDAQDATVLAVLCSLSDQSDWANEGGDPCTPAHWEWVNCSSSIPPRITKIVLSGKNLTGEVPFSLKQLESLTELWLDGNSLTGSIPDLSNLVNLTVLHLENNRLSGHLPSFLGYLPSLRELYVQNNSITGEIPPALLTRKLAFYYDGNPGLNQGRHHERKLYLTMGISIGAFCACLFLFLGSLLLLHLRRNSGQEITRNSLHNMSKPSSLYSLVRAGSLANDEGVDPACYFTLVELEEATQMYSKKIGEGSFGPVYYGKLKDGKEVAVKILAIPSSHGTQQFLNEVALLSRIHHKNLVPLIGYCEEGCQRILVYEYMHNGTLRDHLHGPANWKNLDWLRRLFIVEDTAKGLEYLHDGCNPSIIHRDVKTSNILLDINMRAKVSDFGLSRHADEDRTHISSVACGTVGYLDPGYYANHQLTEKSDVYSFGVVLLEIISGRKPFCFEDYGADWNIVHWARSLIRKGDMKNIVDPSLGRNIRMESVWRIAEVAILSVEPLAVYRPRMQDIVFAIQDAIKIEKGSPSKYEISWDSFTRQSPLAGLPSNSHEIASSDFADDFSTKNVLPSAR